jgi:hypothetical protein
MRFAYSQQTSCPGFRIYHALGRIVAITGFLQLVKLPQRLSPTLPLQMQATIQFLSD